MKKTIRSTGMYGLAIFGLILALTGATHAQVVINASGHVWIRELSPTSTFENDLISVWASPSIGSDAGKRRYGLVEFNVSPLVGKTILGATLRLYGLNSGSQAQFPLKQSAAIIPSGGTPLTSLTWSSYTAEKDAAKQTLVGLGRYNLPKVSTDPLQQNRYVDSAANTADIALIQAEIDGDGVLSLVLMADEDGNDYRRDWGDGNFGSLAPILLVDDGSACRITTLSLPDAGEGDPYAATVQQDGTCTNASWSISGGALPEGLSINSSTGQITGVPDGLGAYSFEVRVTANQGTRSRTFGLRVNAPARAVQIPASFDAWIREVSPGSVYENDLVSIWASNNTYPDDIGKRRYGVVEFDVSSLAGKTLRGARVRMFSRSGGSQAALPMKHSSYNMVSSASTPLASMGWSAYQAERAASASALTGLGRFELTPITGDPTQTESYVNSLAATAGDLATLSAESNGDGKLTLVMIADEDGSDYRRDWGDAGFASQPPLLAVDDDSFCYILTDSLPEATVDASYSTMLEATGGCSGTLTWSLESGTLPEGLTLDPDTGEIGGVPSVTGAFPLGVRLDSSAGYFRRAQLTLTVTGGSRGQFAASGDSWVRESAPNGFFENDLISIWSSASQDGGEGPSARRGLVEFNVSVLAGATLKGAWLSLYSFGQTLPMKQTAQEFTTGPAVGTLTWNTVPGGLMPFQTFGRIEVGAGQGLQTYVNSLPATPLDLAQIEAAAAGDGVLSLLLVADEDGTDYRRDWADQGHTNFPPLLILDVGGGCVILTTTLPPAEFGVAYSATLSASASCGAPQWELRACDLPSGLELNPVTGEISGRPGLGGTFSFTVGLASLSSEVDLTLEVPQSPADLDEDGDVDRTDFNLFTSALSGPGGCVGGGGQDDAVTLSATGDIWVRELAPGNTFEGDLISVWSSNNTGDDAGKRRYGLVEWNVSSLAGQTLAGASLGLWVYNAGSQMGVPLKQTAYVIDTTGKTPLTSLNWNSLVSEHPALGTQLQALGRYEQPPPNVQGTVGKYVFDLGASPADLALIQAAANSPSGKLSVVLVADEDGTDYRRDWGDGTNAGGPGYVEKPGLLVVELAGPGCRITTSSLVDAAVGTAYTGTLTSAGDCTGTKQWQIVGCKLPPGLSLNPATGAITGTPTVGGYYAFTVQLTVGASVRTRSLAITVGGPDADFDDDGDVDLADLDFFALRLGGPFTRSFCGTVTFTSTGAPVAIPDAGSVESAITVPPGFTVSDLNVVVDASHPFEGAVKVEVKSPQGTTVILKNFDSSASAFSLRTYDDEGAPPPVQPLSSFDGQNAGGNWTLKIYDEDSLVDNGVLNSWSLVISAQ